MRPAVEKSRKKYGSAIVNRTGLGDKPSDFFHVFFKPDRPAEWVNRIGQCA
jgi:hypothetical protein